MSKRRNAIPREQMPSWQKFTRTMYANWDADPGYYALQHTTMTNAQRYRAAVAWCTYYNLGIAADASEYQGKRFWEYLKGIYPTAKRATERRHFRGAAGMTALEQWSDRYRHPEQMVEDICAGSRTYFDVRAKCRPIAQFGDYFYWKWCDLHEVLGFGRVNMVGSEKHSPKLPQQGAMLIYEMAKDAGMEWACDLSTEDLQWRSIEPVVVAEVYSMIAAYGRSRNVPARTTAARAFDIQEAETVCCVYKQMSSGSYASGTRTAKAVNRLGAAQSKTAAFMKYTLLRLSPYSSEELAAALASLKE